MTQAQLSDLIHQHHAFMREHGFLERHNRKAGAARTKREAGNRISRRKWVQRLKGWAG